MHVTALVGPGGDVAERYLYDPYGDAAVTDGSAGCAAAQGCTAEGGCATTESAGRASGGRRRGARATSPGGATGAADVLLGCGLRGVLGPDGRTVCRARRGRPGVEPPAEPRAPGGRGGDSGGRRYEYDGTSRRIKAAVDSHARVRQVSLARTCGRSPGPRAPAQPPCPSPTSWYAEPWRFLLWFVVDQPTTWPVV